MCPGLVLLEKPQPGKKASACSYRARANRYHDITMLNPGSLLLILLNCVGCLLARRVVRVTTAVLKTVGGRKSPVSSTLALAAKDNHDSHLQQGSIGWHCDEGSMRTASTDYDILPATQAVLTQPSLKPFRPHLSHEILVTLVHDAKSRLNGAATRAEAFRTILDDVLEHAALLVLPSRRIINATGVIVHTGLGTATLSRQTQARVVEASGATPTGAEGFDDRTALAEHLLTALTGASDACITDQNAAGCMLVGAALGAGGEIICAAQDLTEIGHGARLKDLFEATGSRIGPVGSANCVWIDDYAKAITPRTKAVLRIWHSNYSVSGYVSQVEPKQLAALAHEHRIPFVLNLGAGSLVDLRERGLPYSPTLHDAVAWGTDLVLASGDKLIGGPQAGIAVGSIELCRRLGDHPLYRAVRPSKLTIAALEGTLASYIAGRAWDEVPVLRMLAARLDDLERRALGLAAAMNNGQLRAVAAPDTALCGGAILPDVHLPTWTIRLRHPNMSLDDLYGRLAAHGAVGRRQNDALVLDLRSVLPEDNQALASIVADLDTP